MMCPFKLRDGSGFDFAIIGDSLCPVSGLGLRRQDNMRATSSISCNSGAGIPCAFFTDECYNIRKSI